MISRKAWRIIDVQVSGKLDCLDVTDEIRSLRVSLSCSQTDTEEHELGLRLSVIYVPPPQIRQAKHIR